MPSREPEIVVLGLNRAEALDLKRSQDKVEGVHLEEGDLDPSTAGVLDPVTLVCIPLGALAIQGLIAWLAKDRHDEVIDQEIEIRHADGTVERRVLHVRRKDATSSEHVAEIIANLEVPQVP